MNQVNFFGDRKTVRGENAMLKSIAIRISVAATGEPSRKNTIPVWAV
jgi:hypothetical protein